MMDYKETVLYNTDTLFKDNDLDYDEGGGFTAESVADALVRQAEISFKAGYEYGMNAHKHINLESLNTMKFVGRKEVVDFIGKEPFEHNYSMYGHQIDDCFACKYEAQKKEWGFDD